MTDDIIVPIPNLALPELLFVLSNPAFQERHASARTKLLDGIQADRMCFSFSAVCLLKQVNRDGAVLSVYNFKLICLAS